MIKNKTHLFPILLLVVVSLFATKSLFHQGLFTAHDIWHQVARLYHFDQAVRDGQIPPRWSGGLLNGFGYPIFIFSYLAPWILAEPLVLFGMSIPDAIKAVFIITYALSGVTMYLWLQEMWGKKSAIVSSLIYLWIPYRFANIFVRANIGEAMSFMFFPLIFWGMYRLYRKYTFSSVAIGAIGIGGVLLSHLMVVFLFFITVIGYAFILFLKTKEKLKFAYGSIFTFIMGFGISAFYLLPAIYYQPQTVFKNLYGQHYLNFFTPMSKLVYSPWGFGALGTAGEMSRQVGVIVWLVSGMSLFYIIFRLATTKEKSKILSDYSLPLVFVLGFFSSILFMVKESTPVWKMLEKFVVIDFPWRFLSVTSFCGAVLAGFLVKSINRKFQTLFILFLLIGSWYTNRNHLRVNQYTDIPISLYVDSETTTNTDDEYLPRWVDRQKAREKVVFIKDSQIVVEKIVRSSNKIIFNYESPVEKSVDVHHMYFPGWTLTVDGVSLDIEKSNYGGMKILFPQGDREAIFTYKSTSIMQIGEYITFLTLIIVLVGTLKIKLKSK